MASPAAGVDGRSRRKRCCYGNTCMHRSGNYASWLPKRALRSGSASCCELCQAVQEFHASVRTALSRP